MEGITTPRILNSYLVPLIQNNNLSYVGNVGTKGLKRKLRILFRNELIARRVSRTVLTQREFNNDNKGTIEVKKASLLIHEDTSSSSDRNSPNGNFYSSSRICMFLPILIQPWLSINTKFIRI